MDSTQPIGIFDSGIGGLTVARAVKQILPEESIIYFGDTAHLPYGDKSTAAIQAYSVRIADFLLSKKCKVILIACNSASAAAYELVREFVGKRAMVFDVIHPTVDYLREYHATERVGLIGTKQTVTSHVYDQKISALNKNIAFKALASPLLVPMIEEGIYDEAISSELINRYLSHPTLADIQALILGCTHYPLIKSEIIQYYQDQSKQVTVIDSAETVAKSLHSYLHYHQLISKSHSKKDAFFVSDYTSSFEEITQLFFGKEVSLTHLPIWDEIN